MNHVIKTLGWTLLVATVLGAVLVVATASTIGPLDPISIQFDGHPAILAQFGAGHWLVAVGAAALALIVTLLIVLLAVPVAVLVPLTVAALVLAGALILVAGVAALALSPLIAVAALAWRLSRGNRGHGGEPAAPDATITE
jgi:hypothetical protein